MEAIHNLVVPLSNYIGIFSLNHRGFIIISTNWLVSHHLTEVCCSGKQSWLKICLSIWSNLHVPDKHGSTHWYCRQALSALQSWSSRHSPWWQAALGSQLYLEGRCTHRQSQKGMKGLLQYLMSIEFLWIYHLLHKGSQCMGLAFPYISDQNINIQLGSRSLRNAMVLRMNTK